MDPGTFSLHGPHLHTAAEQQNLLHLMQIKGTTSLAHCMGLQVVSVWDPLFRSPASHLCHWPPCLSSKCTWIKHPVQCCHWEPALTSSGAGRPLLVGLLVPLRREWITILLSAAKFPFQRRCSSATNRVKSARAYGAGLEMRCHCHGPDLWKRHGRSGSAGIPVLLHSRRSLCCTS